MPVRVSNACIPKALQDVDSDGKPLPHTLGIVTYSFTNAENEEMFYVVISNKYELTIKSTLVEQILREEEIHEIEYESNDLDPDLHNDANNSFLSNHSSTSAGSSNSSDSDQPHQKQILGPVPVGQEREPVKQPL